MSGVVEHWFYHLKSGTLDQAISGLLDKCLERQWRVQVASPSPERLAALDTQLWTTDPASFLPHGLATDPDAANLPVVLSDSALPTRNGASVALLLDGASVDMGAAAELARCLWVFEDADTLARDAARTAFRAARQSGQTARYFIENGRGGWQEQTL